MNSQESRVRSQDGKQVGSRQSGVDSQEGKPQDSSDKPQERGLTHFGEQGRARMVDVSEKKETLREAVAKARVFMKAETLALIKEGKVKKGDVLAVAQIAGIMAAKKTWDLIPMCHPLPITRIDMNFYIDDQKNSIEIEAIVRTKAATGVEMEALTAVSVAGLTIYDMCKAVDRGITITDIRLIKKSGGKSGEFVRKEDK